jgi:tripartite-type tricarboxylate transporter receptor subunit TctC
VPAGTPAAAIETLSGALRAGVRHPDAQQRLTALGVVPIGGTPADYAANLRSETAKWAEVVRKANVTLD